MSSSSSLFDCNICLDTASEPVVTACGHLYCWPCLYRWMHARPGENTCLCPICKLVLHEGNIIPIYGRGVDRGRITKAASGVSSRPAEYAEAPEDHK